MSTSPTSLFTQGICSPIQQALNDVAKPNAPSMKRDRLGYLEALVSPLNRLGNEPIAIPSDGRQRTVEITYFQRGSEDLVASERSTDCLTENYPAPLSVQLQANYQRYITIGYSEDELRRLCEPNNQSYRAQTVMSHINAVLVSINKHILSLQAAEFGTFADGSASKTFDLIDSGTSALKPYEFVRILREFDEVSGQGTPLLIGAGDLYMAARLHGLSCCNANGINTENLKDEFAFFYDKHLDGVLTGADNFIMLAPGAVQFAPWNRYVAGYARKGEDFETGILKDPFTGIDLDFKVVYDRCQEKFFVELGLSYALFILPVSGFAPGDPLYGVNYTFAAKSN